MRVGEEASLALARIDALHTALTHLVLEGGDLRADRRRGRRRPRRRGGVHLHRRPRARLGPDAEAREALGEAGCVDATGRIRVERVKEDGLLLGAGEVRALRVAAGGTDLARLVCLRLDRPITEVDVHALERVAIVAALLITRQSAVSAVENKYQGDFLRDLLVRGVGDESYVEEHVSAFGWTLGRPVVVVVAEIDPQPREEKPASREQRRTWQERFSAAWRQVSHALDPGIPSVDFSSEVVTLLPVAPATPDAGAHRWRRWWPTTSYDGWSPAWRATRAAAGAASPSG